MQPSTRSAAKVLGKTRYFTGLPCPDGHTDFRQTSSGSCVECRRQNAADWKSKNPERTKAQWIKWRQNNPEKALAITQRAVTKWRTNNPEKAKELSERWRARHPEKHKAAAKLWQTNNPESGRASSRTHRRANVEAARAREKAWRAKNPDARKALNIKRRAQKLLASGEYDQDDVHRILEDQGGRCAAAHCGGDIALSYTIDHILPLSRGGSNYKENIQLLCSFCNSSKGAKTMDEWTKFIAKHPPKYRRREIR